MTWRAVVIVEVSSRGCRRGSWDRASNPAMPAGPAYFRYRAGAGPGRLALDCRQGFRGSAGRGCGDRRFPFPGDDLVEVGDPVGVDHVAGIPVILGLPRLEFPDSLPVAVASGELNQLFHHVLYR